MNLQQQVVGFENQFLCIEKYIYAKFCNMLCNEKPIDNNIKLL